jgi:hypothetical protein
MLRRYELIVVGESRAWYELNFPSVYLVLLYFK